MSAAAVNEAQTAALKAMFGVLLDENDPGLHKDALIALEGVVIGTFMMVVRLGGDEPVFEVFAERVRERLAETRLSPVAPAGSA